MELTMPVVHETLHRAMCLPKLALETGFVHAEPVQQREIVVHAVVLRKEQSLA